MTKRRRQGRRCDCGEKPRPARRRKNLYLVLDDWDKGFSIHKLDVHSFFSSDSDDDDDGTSGGGHLRRLPDPPALRLTEEPDSPMLFAALGSRIFIAKKEQYSAQAAGSLVYDTETAAMTLCPRFPENVYGLFVAVTAAGEKQKQQQKLYALTYDNHGGQRGTDGHLVSVSIQALSWARSPAASPIEPRRPRHEWSWESVSAPPAPFEGNDEVVVSYAVHPDGHTIFFSTYNTLHRGIGNTYSFDTKRREWRSHGEWMLPFRDQGYFERELDAWVGLHRDGYVCACQVASLNGGAAPEWRKTEHKMFREAADPARHLGATLTYMGSNRFCLIESVIREDVEHRYAYGDGDGCALRVTVFGMKYSREGELQATVRRATNSYAVSRYMPGFCGVPFWM